MKNKVLLIDDSVTIHRVIDLSIDLEKYDLVKVFTEEAASAKLKDVNFDFILIDNKLENTNIAEYSKSLKGLQPIAKLILLVGAFDKIDAEYIARLGADDYLVKPFDSQSLNTKLTLSDEVRKIKEEQAAKTKPKDEEIADNDNQINNIYCDIVQKPQMESMLTPKPDDGREKRAPNMNIQQQNISKTMNKLPIFHDPSEDPPKSQAGGKQIINPSSSAANENKTNDKTVNELKIQTSPTASFDTFTAQSDIQEEKSADTLKDQSENKNEIKFSVSTFDAFSPQSDSNSSQNDVGFQKEKLFNYGDSEETDTQKPQAPETFGGIEINETTPEDETQDVFGGVGTQEETSSGDYQDFRGENRFKELNREKQEETSSGNYQDFRGENRFKEISHEKETPKYADTEINNDNKISEYAPTEINDDNKINEYIQPESKSQNPVSEQKIQYEETELYVIREMDAGTISSPQKSENVSENKTAANEQQTEHGEKALAGNNTQKEQINNENNNAPKKEGEAIKMTNETIKTQTEEENNANDFYKLDEDDIFNPKPVGQIFETEILSIATPNNEKKEENKPLAQKFEEEVLSIDEPTQQEADYFPIPDIQENVAFEPPKIEENPKKEEQKKTISQKFEEEILSIEDPADNLSNMRNTNNGELKTLNEVFDNEILLIDDPSADDKISPNAKDNEPDEDMERLENELFAKSQPSHNIIKATKTSPFENKKELDADIMDAQTFMKEIDSPIPSKNDDFFHDKTLVKEFADDIFPHDENEDEFNFDNNIESKNIDDDLFLSKNHNLKPNEDDDLFAAKNNDFKPKDVFESDDIFENIVKKTAASALPNDDLFAVKNDDFKPKDIFESSIKPSATPAFPDDDSLDLDALLGMDLSPEKPEQQKQKAPDKKIDTVAPQTNKTTDIEDLDDALFSELPQASAPAKGEDPFFAGFDEDITPKFEGFTTEENAPFDVVEMGNVVGSAIQNNLENSILSGITVTISKEEIMKMVGGALDKNFLEKTVQQVLAQNMREIVRSVVPAIAEKFIKEEIEKLKNEEEA